MGTSFPQGFLWGAATSAYQVEGGASEDGRGDSIWDTFARTPGMVRNGDTGDVAADHYHHWRDDVALMRELGLQGYRFSVAWPRIQPTGRGRPNRRGLDFYRRLVDELRSSGIEPLPTLYHWDLPQPLEEAGGWPARDTAYRFAEYARHVAEALGEAVQDWFTLNEPFCSAFLGYGLGIHAPGRSDGQAAVRAAHHLLLGHGLAVEALRRAAPGSRVGIVLNVELMRAASESADDVAAAVLADGMHNRLFLDPIFRGRYPEDVLRQLEQVVDLGHIEEGDDRLIAAPIDLLGVNYYSSSIIRVASDGEAPVSSVWPGDERIRAVAPDGPTTAMGWRLDPAGFEEMLLRVQADYGGVPLYVAENGAAYDDVPDGVGDVHDEARIAYLDQHLRAVGSAISAGADVRGYFVWSLLDNFEWAEGYSKRFGIVRVDYETERRVPKESARWYGRVIAANAIPAA